MENTLTPATVATNLGVSGSTLRKYSLILEENGITFKRNAKNSRQYTESDVMTLQRMITLMKTDGVTVENAAYAVSEKVESVPREAAKDGVIHDDSERQNADIAGVTLNEIRKLKDEIKEQREVIDGFRLAQEKRDSYFVEILEELQNEIHRLNETAALPAPETKPDTAEIVKEPKKGFFQRFFK